MLRKFPKISLEIIAYCLLTNICVGQQPNSVNLKDSSLAEFRIIKTWILPQVLKEISGISYIDADRFACIQDQIGSIFIYNISTSSIEATIPFATPGDYEGVTVIGEDAYVACADGRIIEVTGYRSTKPVVKEYGTHLTVKQNVEGICFDKKNKRLLVAIKGEEAGNPSYKGIYAFDLAEKKMIVKPVFKIDLQDAVFTRWQSRRNNIIFRPSEIDIDPLSGDIYLTSGKRAQVLIMDKTGKIKALYALDKSVFNQPEGMLFTPSGDLYIANEGKGQDPGKIVHVQLKPIR